MTEDEVNTILNLPIEQDNDAGAITIGDFLYRLLGNLIFDPESFSGKRPFGNSGWIYGLYAPLVRAKLIEGKYDEEFDELEDVNDEKANQLLFELLQTIFKVK